MKPGSIADFLVRTVLDEAFRELTLSNPQRAFEGFDLTTKEKEILCARDHRLLGLLGAVVTQGKPVAEHPSPQAPSTPATPTLPALPEVMLLLRLAPRAAPGADSGAEVAYEASLHPWAGDGAATTGPNTAEQDERGADAAVGEVRWMIRITPQVVNAKDSGLEVAYSASIHPVTGPDEPAPPPAMRPTAELSGSPWNHHVESSAARAAARAVHAAEPGQRYARLLELVQALQTGDESG